MRISTWGVALLGGVGTGVLLWALWARRADPPGRAPSRAQRAAPAAATPGFDLGAAALASAPEAAALATSREAAPSVDREPPIGGPPGDPGLHSGDRVRVAFEPYSISDGPALEVVAAAAQRPSYQDDNLPGSLLWHAGPSRPDPVQLPLSRPSAGATMDIGELEPPFRGGAPLALWVSVQRGGTPLPLLGGQVTLLDSAGQPLTSALCRDDGVAPDREAGDSVLACVLPAVAPGAYSATLQLADESGAMMSGLRPVHVVSPAAELGAGFTSRWTGDGLEVVVPVRARRPGRLRAEARLVGLDGTVVAWAQGLADVGAGDGSVVLRYQRRIFADMARPGPYRLAEVAIHELTASEGIVLADVAATTTFQIEGGPR